MLLISILFYFYSDNSAEGLADRKRRMAEINEEVVYDNQFLTANRKLLLKTLKNNFPSQNRSSVLNKSTAVILI